MLRTFRFILVILLYSIPAHALIEINSTPTTDPSTCDGTIEIAFTNETANHIWDVYITYFDDPSAAVITQSGLTGTMVHSFPNLCSGEYFIEVAPAGTECGFEYNATVPFNLDGEVFSAYFDFEFGSDYCEVFFQFNITGGNVTEYLWYFGDGAFSNVQEPSHIYTEPGCHTVILETTNSLGEYNEYEEIVCTPNCNVEVPELECEINGPFTATAGAQIMIQPTVSGGVLPYSYNWITPSGAYATPDELSGLGPHSITIDENANNGQNLIWFLEVEDSEGNTTQCEYTVIIAGGIPALDLVVFTDNQPLTPVTLFANIDFSNITHPINYIFNLDVDNGAVIPMGVQDEGQLNYSGGLPAGNYTATVVATDQMGTYQASTTFTIDGSVTPPPPAAPQVIIRDLATNASTPVTLEGGECVTIWFFILNDPFSGGTESPFPDCVDEYFIALRVFPEGGNEDDEYDIGGFQTDPGCPNNPFAFELCHSHFDFCSFSSVELVATFKPAHKTTANNDCCSVAMANNAEVESPRFRINLADDPPEISTVSIIEGCDPYLSVSPEGGCPLDVPEQIPVEAPCPGTQNYTNVQWTAYFANDPNVSVQSLYPDDNLFLEPTSFKCVYLNKEHPYFLENNNLTSYFYVEVSLVDQNGLTGKKKQLIGIPLPFRSRILNTEKYICAGLPVNLSNAYSAIGGIEPYSFSWVGPNGFASSLENPSVMAPQEGETGIYNLTITDATGCTSSTEVKVLGIELSLESMRSSFTECSDPVQLGPDISDIGGSGNYHYIWTAKNESFEDVSVFSTGMSDPVVLNPWVTPLVETFYYILTLTDLSGQCSIEKTVSVRRGDVSLVAIAGMDEELCNGEEVIIGVPTNGSGSSNSIIEWTSTNPHFEGGNTPELLLNSALNRNQGVFTYTITVVDENGCIATDDVTIEVAGNPWLHANFTSRKKPVLSSETEVFAWDFPHINRFIYVSNANPGDEDYKAESGAIEPLTYSWTPSGEVFEPNNAYAGDKYPVLVTFNPNINSSYELVVSDATGCTEKFLTNRYSIFSQETPTVSASNSTSGICGDGHCIDVSINTHFMGGEPLPSIYYIEVRNGNSGNDKIAAISLIDSEAGIYQGSVCFTTEELEGDSFISLGFLSYSFSGPNNRWYFFLEDFPGLTVEINAPEVPSLLCIDGSISEGTTEKAITINVSGNVDPLCTEDTDINVGDGNLVEFIGGKNGNEGGVHIFGETTITGSNTEFWAYIDPCLIDEDELLDPPSNLTSNPEEELIPEKITKERIEESTENISENSFNVYPNPFNEQLLINYSFTSEDSKSVRLVLYNITGRVEAIIENHKILEQGDYTITYNGNNLQPGIYFIELTVGGNRQIQKVIKIDIK